MQQERRERYCREDVLSFMGAWIPWDLWRHLIKCTSELSFQEIRRGTHLSTGFHSLLTKVAPWALTSPVLLGCTYVTSERVPVCLPWSRVREANERHKVLPGCTYMKMFEAYPELVATKKWWGWEDLEWGTRHILYTSVSQAAKTQKSKNRADSQSNYSQGF